MNKRDEAYRQEQLARIRAEDSERLEGVRAFQKQTQLKRKEVVNNGTRNNQRQLA